MQVRLKMTARELSIQCQIEGGDVLDYDYQADDIDVEVEIDAIVEADPVNGTFIVTHTADPCRAAECVDPVSVDPLRDAVIMFCGFDGSF